MSASELEEFASHIAARHVTIDSKTLADAAAASLSAEKKASASTDSGTTKVY